MRRSPDVAATPFHGTRGSANGGPGFCVPSNGAKTRASSRSPGRTSYPSTLIACGALAAAAVCSAASVPRTCQLEPELEDQFRSVGWRHCSIGFRPSVADPNSVRSWERRTCRCSWQERTQHAQFVNLGFEEVYGLAQHYLGQAVALRIQHISYGASS
jgi:hypothetical protein